MGRQTTHLEAKMEGDIISAHLKISWNLMVLSILDPLEEQVQIHPAHHWHVFDSFLVAGVWIQSIHGFSRRRTKCFKSLEGSITFWLAVSTPLKNMKVKMGIFPRVRVKIKHIWVATTQLWLSNVCLQLLHHHKFWRPTVLISHAIKQAHPVNRWSWNRKWQAKKQTNKQTNKQTAKCVFQISIRMFKSFDSLVMDPQLPKHQSLRL